MSLEATIRARRGACVLDLEVAIASGQTLVVVGPNGAGKSTLVDVLAGLWPLSAGAVAIGGRPVERAAERLRLPPQARGVGVMFQGLALFPHLSALANVAYGLLARGVPRLEAETRARAWLERLGVAEVAERRPAALSGGQAQRVALARAVIVAPDLLILDEPLSALDVHNRQSARERLRATLAEAPGAKLVITHDARDLVALADQVLVLEDGRIGRSGPLAECLAEPGSPYLAAMLREQGLGPT
ncbi:MAG: ATP-binding cassette domain-containing protein [Myxococcales bacterium]|nr:ATP-binding cassette domain-containing protein [Myxococcales bacterium]